MRGVHDNNTRKARALKLDTKTVKITYNAWTERMRRSGIC
jgi:hypothetical protein